MSCSFYEIGIYDIPTSLDKVKKVTGADKITYIGHSTGSTAALVYASLLPKHAKDTINLFILMAADSYIKYPKFPTWTLYPLPLPLKVNDF